MAVVQESGPNFTLPVTPDLVENYVRQRVASVSGIPSNQVHLDQALSMLHTLTNRARRGKSPDRSDPRYRQLIASSTDIRAGEASREQEVTQMLETYTDQAHRLSLGLSFASIIPALEEVRERHQIQNPNILLAGALTLATATEFTAATRHVFPSPNLTIVDPGKTRASEWDGEGTFIKGNFLDPKTVPAQSQDVVMSDFLLNYLLSPHDNFYQSELFAARDFAKAAQRALKPGGQLIMVDHSLPESVAMEFLRDPILAEVMKEPNNPLFEEYREMITEEFEKAGFTNVHIQHARELIQRRDVTEIMAGGRWENLDHAVLDPRTMIITAQKA